LLAATRHSDRGDSPRRDAALIRLADLRLRQGRLEEASELLVGFDQHPDATRTVASLHLARGRVAQARDTLERAAARSDDEVPRVGEMGMIGPLLALLVEACLADGDRASADQAAQRLQNVAAAQRGPYLRAAAALARGRVSIATGEGDARSVLHEALEGFAEARLPMDLAIAHLVMARAAAADGARDVAVAEAKVALREFERLDAARHVDSTAELLRSLGARVRSGPRRNGALTKREEEVLQLIGDGLSNPEIAEQLHIARKTVEHHVGNVLAKLGLRNRAEAVAYAVRERASRTREPVRE
jgi:DNA-binding NarL/FixJ family response regulator